MGDILGIGVTALNALQTKISTTSHNIANAAQEGYTRQTTELLTLTPMLKGGSFIGSGVRTGVTKQVVDYTLSGVHRGNVSAEGQWNTALSLASQVNSLMASEETGVSGAIQQFFDAMQDLALNPTSPEQRQVLLSESQNLVRRVNALDARLDDMQNDAQLQLREVITQINGISANLVRLNEDIEVASNLGVFAEPNDLQDRREAALTELAKLVDVSVTRQSNNSIDVFIGNGVTLVLGGQRTELSVDRNPDDVYQLDILTQAGRSQNRITDSVVGGKLGALKNFRQEMLDPTRASLGRVVLGLVQTVNAQHHLGLDANQSLGTDYFADLNALELQLGRVQPNRQNLGTAVFKASIDPIARQHLDSGIVLGQGSALVNAGTLPTLDSTDLVINGVEIRSARASDDTISTTDNAASAIAMAAAINASAQVVNVSAKAECNLLYLGDFTPGVTSGFATGQFVINGVNVITKASSPSILVRDINSFTPSTGVQAMLEANGTSVSLMAQDGRNIHLKTDGNAVSSRFSHFDTTGGGALNQVQRAAVSLHEPNGHCVVGGAAPADAGLTATPSPPDGLTESDYRVLYDGTHYRVWRMLDDVLVHSGPSSSFSTGGWHFSLHGGVVEAGDSFLVRPTHMANQRFALNLNSIDQIATASPIRVTSDMANQGTGVLKRGAVLNTSGFSQPMGNNTLGNAFARSKCLTPPIRIEFLNDAEGEATRYQLFDVTAGGRGVPLGPEQTFVPNAENAVFPLVAVANTSPPGPNPAYTYDPGYRVSLTGAPKAGDVFYVEFNTDPAGDVGNLESILSLKNEALFENGRMTYQGLYAQMMTRVGSQTQSMEVNANAAETLRRGSTMQMQSISGVNLEEEAADLIRLQQAYRAAAHLLQVGSRLFEVLLDAVHR